MLVAFHSLIYGRFEFKFILITLNNTEIWKRI